MESEPRLTLPALQERGRLYAQVRAFFAVRNVLEVDTPALYPGAPAEAALQTFAVPMTDTCDWHLQPSPEFAMKRLLARHPVPVFQLAHAFRSGESGRLHNPEFTLLEWYRPGFSLRDLEQECLALLAEVLGARPVTRLHYMDALRRYAAAGIAPAAPADLDEDQQLDLLFEDQVRPALDPDAFTVVSGFPASQAELAAVREDAHGEPYTCRFEIFYRGMELLNAALELRDGAEYLRRVAAQNRRRAERGLPAVAPDTKFAAALDRLPDCCGAALGMDRLLLCKLSADHLEAVMPFTAGLL